MRALTGFTLIETLATVVLLAIVAALGAIGLSGASEATRLREAVSILEAADADARSLARANRHAMLTLSMERHEIRVWSAGTTILTRPLPASARIHLVDGRDDAPIESIVYDPAGRCLDYAAVVRLDEQERIVRVAGLTGWTE